MTRFYGTILDYHVLSQRHLVVFPGSVFTSGRLRSLSSLGMLSNHLKVRVVIYAGLEFK